MESVFFLKDTWEVSAKGRRGATGVFFLIIMMPKYKMRELAQVVSLN